VSSLAATTITATVPGDKSLAIRALLLTLLADGPCHLDNVPHGRITAATLEALRVLGAHVTVTPLAPARDVDCGRLAVVVVPPHRLHTGTTIDCGGSATLVRLLMGLLGGRGIDATLVGSTMLSRRPMGRVADPLRALFGRDVIVTTDGHLPAHVVAGDGPLVDATIRPGDSAQVRAAVMLAATAAAIPVTIWSALPGRRHTEHLLARLGSVVVDDDPCPVTGRTRRTRLVPAPIGAFRFTVPADPSAAAFLQALSASLPMSSSNSSSNPRLRIDNLVIDAERRGFLDVLTRFGAHVDIDVDTIVVAHGLRTATVTTGPGLLGAVDVGAREIPDLVDEVPILAALCTRGTAPSTLRGLAELRVKESDRLARIVDVLRAFGAGVEFVDDDGLRVVPGPGRIPEAPIVTDHDHRIGMMAAVLGAMKHPVPTDVAVDDPGCVDESWPGFVAQLAAVATQLGAP